MNEVTVQRDWAFRGCLLNVEVQEVELPSGRRGRREIIRHPGAAVVLARTPDGRFVFVQQYRKAIECVMLEAIAGTLDKGESPDACARREVSEESGYRVLAIRKLGVCHPAPGYTDECLNLFLADVEVDPSPLPPDEDESITVRLLTDADIRKRIVSGEITDAKTIAIWSLFEMTENTNSGFE